MNTNAKKMYVAPSIKEHVIELEQGIAAGSGVDPNAATINEVEGSSNAGYDGTTF